jgi:predicted ATPase/class 3 adenylate cyclase
MATRAKSRAPSSARPTGAVTFLFSDIEGSTVRWEGAPDKMELALERHDALMRGAIEAHGGYVFKTMGDAFCAAFATAPDALAAALDVQRSLAAEDFSAVEGIRVRVALHTGQSTERDGDYFGPTVNRVARLLAIGHGGQVLVSDACTELLQGETLQHCGLRDLGAHRLKDLAQPERVHQLVAPDLLQEFPALRSLDHLSNNLPAQLTSFVGREDAVAEIKALLEQDRLVTLVGTGGAGKTRCAIHVGAEMVDGSRDGVWLAELAPISDPSLVASVIARALNVQESPNRPILEALLTYLKRRRLLLILDNCEHVIEEARRVVAAIVHGCPEVRILATSREGLNIAGEEVYRVPSLAVPSEGARSLEELSRCEAVQLFSDRALSGDKRFTLNDENIPHVAEICCRLDGIPLAIELAAARVKILSPKQLTEMLDERFRVLTGGDRSALPRHRTMRALIDWSYDLLSDDERALFRKLSIFAAGFTLQTASAVCSGEAIDELATLDLLSSLVDKSLVHAEQVGDGVRYGLLESTRQYGRERLAERGEYAAVAQAHAVAFLALGEELNRIFETTPERVWLANAEPELENFRAALSWALGAQGDVLLGQRLAGALRPAWTRLAAAEGQRRIQAARDLTVGEIPAPVDAALDLAEAALATALAQPKTACARAERALALYHELDDPLRVAQARHLLGRALVNLGNVEKGEMMLVAALEEARALGVHSVIGDVLQSLALARGQVGDVAAARPLFAEALAMFRSVGAERAVSHLAGNLAEVEFHAGNTVDALRLENEALATYHSFNHTLGAAIALCNIAAYLTALERYDEARISGRDSLVAARDAQWEAGGTWALQHLAAIAARRPPDDAEHGRDDRQRAARLLGYVDARLAALEALREYTEQQEYDAMILALRDALGADECAKLMNEGSTWCEDQAVAEAMLI